jgi:hypothetical protein
MELLDISFPDVLLDTSIVEVGDKVTVFFIFVSSFRV